MGEKRALDNVIYMSIPVRIFKDKRLSRTSVLLYAVISSLSTMRGYCFATNRYLCEEMGFTLSTLQRCIAELIDCGYIRTELIRDDTGNIEERRIYLNADFRDEADIRSGKGKKPVEDRHAYGSMKNVLLTDKQYSDLKALYPTIDDEIESMSLYLSANGKSYKNYYSALLNWMKRRESEKPKKAGKWDNVDY